MTLTSLTSAGMDNEGSIPNGVAVLGYAGLLPPALLLVADRLWANLHEAGAGLVLVPLYAGLIFSFLGGCWWAFALKEDRPSISLLVLGVAPALASFGLIWVSVALGTVLATVALAGLIAVSPLADALIGVRGLVPPWWLRFRFRLSMGLAALTALSIYPAMV
ncbi:MAG: DUF3429 domain-containing protein [Sphingomicrobium sp.]